MPSAISMHIWRLVQWMFNDFVAKISILRYWLLSRQNSIFNVCEPNPGFSTSRCWNLRSIMNAPWPSTDPSSTFINSTQKGWYKVATHFVSIMPRTHSRFPSEKRFLKFSSLTFAIQTLTAEQPHERCHITGGSKPLLALPAWKEHGGNVAHKRPKHFG